MTAIWRVTLITSSSTQIYLPSVRMYLHLGHNPRILYLSTDSHEQRLGLPHRVLTFRAANANANQVVVGFLPGDEVNLTGTVRLTHRAVKGCLGLISVENGASTYRRIASAYLYLPCT